MKRSKFSLSHSRLLTCDMGELVPIGLTEVLPGDSIQQATSLLLRCSPLLAPVMHPVKVRIHHWFVPNRLVWDGWEDFITGGPDGMNNAIPPTIDDLVVTAGSLMDYMGLPVGANPIDVSAIPFRGYAMIWNEFYRDQDLQAELPVSTADGLDGVTNLLMQNVCWEKDYFTSARPWPQKGPAVTIPFATTAPVVPDGTQLYLRKGSNGAVPYGATLGDVGSEAAVLQAPGAGSGDGPAFWGPQTGLMADLSGATAINVNDLREAFAIQRYEEARARYGSRYTEYLRYLGVRSSDARLQRPEYLGGGQQTIQFSEVLQTGPDTEGAGVADIKGHGIAAMRSNRYRRFFEEHGYVFSLLSVQPKTMYQQGIARHWSRQTKHDYFQKELQHIGQQEIYNREVYAAHAAPLGVFGFQDRYDEYRRSESGVAGDFRNTLDYWHYGRIFASDPTLNGDFVKSNPSKRPNAVQSEDVLWIMAYHSTQARRLVSKIGTSFIK